MQTHFKRPLFDLEHQIGYVDTFLSGIWKQDAIREVTNECENAFTRMSKNAPLSLLRFNSRCYKLS
eukprot:4150615-Amphidinium_carterae.1